MATSAQPRSGRLRRALSAFACAIAVSLAFASSAAALPANFWGVSPQLAFAPDQLERLKRGGVDSVRMHITWSQPAPGAANDWSSSDAIIGAIARARMETLPFLFGAPPWAVPAASVPGTGGKAKAPKFLPVRNARQRSGWQQFIREAVARYGPRGSFWAENPDIPRRPVRHWQIWNEPNFKYFVARPNPAEYGRLVKLSYAAARSVDSGARIVLGGLFAYPGEARIKRGPKQAFTAPDFLDRMYRSTPGIKSRFHGYALHPYTSTFKRLPLYVNETRRALIRHRDGGKGLWVTELGWSSQKPSRGNSFAKGPGGQAAQLKGAFKLLRANQRKWRAQRVYWFSVDDLPGSCNFCDGSGLFGDGFLPKPSWHAYVRFAGGRAN